MFRTILPLTVRNILLKTDEYTIFKYYCKGFDKIGKLFNSPLRDDPDPSAIISPFNGKLMFRDFGLGISLKAIEFVQYIYNSSFKEALQTINLDLGLCLDGEKDPTRESLIPLKSNYNPKEYTSTNTTIEIYNIPHTEETYSYWEEYGWNLDLINKAKIRNIDGFWITKFDRKFYNTTRELSFSYDYYWTGSIFRRKIYRPYNDYKFFTNADYTIIQGWDLLPKNGGKNLFITSSMKDIAPFMRLGHYAIAGNNEQMFIPENIFYTKIKPRWENIYIYLDNDSTGIRNALKWQEKYQLKAIWNPTRAPKDPSDYVKAYQLREFNYLLQNLI